MFRLVAFFGLFLAFPSFAASTNDSWTATGIATTGGGQYYQDTQTGEYCDSSFSCYQQYVVPSLAPSTCGGLNDAPNCTYPPYSPSASSGGLSTSDDKSGGALVGQVGETSFAGVGVAITAGAGVMLGISALWLAFVFVRRAVRGSGDDDDPQYWSTEKMLRVQRETEKQERAERRRDKAERLRDRLSHEKRSTEALRERRAERAERMDRMDREAKDTGW